ncbi:hypothetical protein [Streptomyces sp. B15]|uniref:hypothetical protein n=1 Tax=Streptomyces sp. B15 TaxID=1537797 RepID=UPI001B3693DF|nr:hypothetical protein [Streptomyces sp. B15]MBQ1122664.1 hypothetical protein [Streptomyces sp. B15]
MNGPDTCITLLETVATGLARYWDGHQVTVPAAWTNAPLTDRTDALAHLAWQARGAEIAHPATHPASRLALAAEREAWAWGLALAAGVHLPPFQLRPHWLAHESPEVQLEACIRLLAAARTGVLPAAPYLCAICPAEQDLHLISHVRCTGPNLEEWRCSLCARLPIDPKDLPETVEAISRQHRRRSDDRRP